MCCCMIFFCTQTISEESKREDSMAKKGMRRPDPSDPHGTESNKKQKVKRNKQPPVPEIQGKARTGSEKAGVIGNGD